MGAKSYVCRSYRGKTALPPPPILNRINSFSYTSTFSSIYFFIIAFLNISIVLIRFTDTLFSFACFANSLTSSKKCGKGIFFETIYNLLVKFAVFWGFFCISCSSISILSRFSLAIVFRSFSSFISSISRFSSSFNLSIFSFYSFYLSISFIISLGFDIFICCKKIIKNYNNSHSLWFRVVLAFSEITTLCGMTADFVYLKNFPNLSAKKKKKTLKKNLYLSEHLTKPT